jgi:hypothetical protein
MAITAGQAVCAYTFLLPTPNGACVMTTAIKTAATTRQVREPTRELTVDQLALVIGGAPSAAPKKPPVYYTVSMENTMISSL